MTRKRHTEEQIIAVLRDAQAGSEVQKLCHKHGISNATFYKWRTKYVGLKVSDGKKLRQLEDENGRLKQIVAEQVQDIHSRKAAAAQTEEGHGGARVALQKPTQLGRYYSMAFVPDRLVTGQRFK